MKDQRARRQHLRCRTGIVGGIQRPLGHRDIAGRRNEFSELAIGDRRGIDEEGTDLDGMLRRFLGIMPVGPIRNLPPSMKTMSGNIAAPPATLVTGLTIGHHLLGKLGRSELNASEWTRTDLHRPIENRTAP